MWEDLSYVFDKSSGVKFEGFESLLQGKGLSVHIFFDGLCSIYISMMTDEEFYGESVEIKWTFTFK